MSETTDRDRMQQAMARIWAQSAELTQTRIGTIESAAMALLEGDLAPAARDEAMRAAHALAGSVGSFGFANASSLSREAEMILRAEGAVAPASVLRLSEIAVDLRRELVTAQSAPVAPTMPSEHTAPAIAAVGKIVAVDDDPSLLELLKASLEDRGIAVHGLNDSTTAAERIAAIEPDLVILDVDMPGMDGIAVCRKLRAQPATMGVPILFLTTHTEPEVVSALFAAGADDHITKPVQIDQLATRIGNRLSRVRQTRRTSTSGEVPVFVRPETNEQPVLPLTTDVAIVDDDPTLTALLSHTLNSRGHSSVVLADGNVAVDALTGAAPKVVPSVILLDVSLPGIDGLAVLRALARDGVTKRSRVIMLTARSSESEVLQALEIGAHDHIGKPFSVPVLMRRLRVALEDSESAR